MCTCVSLKECGNFTRPSTTDRVWVSQRFRLLAQSCHTISHGVLFSFLQDVPHAMCTAGRLSSPVGPQDLDASSFSLHSVRPTYYSAFFSPVRHSAFSFYTNTDRLPVIALMSTRLTRPSVVTPTLVSTLCQENKLQPTLSAKLERRAQGELLVLWTASTPCQQEVERTYDTAKVS